MVEWRDKAFKKMPEGTVRMEKKINILILLSQRIYVHLSVRDLKKKKSKGLILSIYR